MLYEAYEFALFTKYEILRTTAYRLQTIQVRTNVYVASNNSGSFQTHIVISIMRGLHNCLWSEHRIVTIVNFTHCFLVTHHVPIIHRPFYSHFY